MTHLLRLGRPDRHTLEQLLARAGAASLTYDHVGSTLSAPGSSDRKVSTEHLELGVGAATFDAAVSELRTWVCHRGLGADVFPADAPLQVGTSLLVVLHVGPVSIVVPNRVVAVVDEPRRIGFAYGTLEGHQERGEESYVVEHLDDDRVVATIGLDARAATTAARLAAPAVGWFQRLAVRRYLAAWRAAVES
ncbi:MAG: DUF1990 domain-containing protein [Actinomycetota bacterium]|nr:DUF1990 domain-containing protein [Actinomycetota bacterium]